MKSNSGRCIDCLVLGSSTIDGTFVCAGGNTLSKSTIIRFSDYKKSFSLSTT